MADEPDKARPAAPVVLRIKLRYDDVDAMIQRFAANVGKTGLFLPTKSLQPIGAEIKFELRLSTDQPVLVGLGRVKASREPDPTNPRATFGMAVELMRVTRESRDLILKMLERRKQLGMPEIGIPTPADIDSARRSDFVDTGVRDAASGAVPAYVPAVDSSPLAASGPVLTAPRRTTGPIAVAKVTTVEPLAPEAPRKKRVPVADLIASASGPIATAIEGLEDSDVDVAAVLARARTLAAGADLDSELEALRDSAAAPLAAVDIEAASAELARQLGGAPVRRDRSARWAPPPPTAPEPTANGAAAEDRRDAVRDMARENDRAVTRRLDEVDGEQARDIDGDIGGARANDRDVERHGAAARDVDRDIGGTSARDVDRDVERHGAAARDVDRDIGGTSARDVDRDVERHGAAAREVDRDVERHGAAARDVERHGAAARDVDRDVERHGAAARDVDGDMGGAAAREVDRDVERHGAAARDVDRDVERHGAAARDVDGDMGGAAAREVDRDVERHGAVARDDEAHTNRGDMRDTAGDDASYVDRRVDAGYERESARDEDDDREATPVAAEADVPRTLDDDGDGDAGLFERPGRRSFAPAHEAIQTEPSGSALIHDDADASQFEEAHEVEPEQIHDEIHRLDEGDYEEVEHTQIGQMPVDPDAFEQHAFATMPSDTALADRLDAELAQAEEEAASDDLGFSEPAGGEQQVATGARDYVIPLGGAEEPYSPSDSLVAALDAAAVEQAAADEEDAEEIEEIDDFEILAEADADDEDLLVSAAEREQPHDVVAARSPHEEMPPARPSFLSRLELDEDSGYHEAAPARRFEGSGTFEEFSREPGEIDPRVLSAGYALRAFEEPERDDLGDFNTPGTFTPIPQDPAAYAARASVGDESYTDVHDDEFDAPHGNYAAPSFVPPDAFDQSDVIAIAPEAVGHHRARPVTPERSAAASGEEYDLETALEALDVDLDDLGAPHAPTEHGSRGGGSERPVVRAGTNRRAGNPDEYPTTQDVRGGRVVTPAPKTKSGRVHKRASTEDGILIDFDDDDDR